MPTDDRRRAIGSVVAVSADRFVIEMHGGTDSFTVVGFDDVHYVARLGSFVMIPAQAEYVVAEIVGLRERDAGAGGEIDKAASAKFLDVVPVGMLPIEGGRFRFGVSVFPSLYSDALYALDEELDRIFDTSSASELSTGPDGVACVPPEATRLRILEIGRSVVFEDYRVKVRIDEFFGGHAAVLGNTGSGKSCTVASILQELFEKPDEHYARGATFVVLDVNGEYHQAFAGIAAGGIIGVDRLVLDGTAAAGRFRIPHWFLDLSEWELLLQASERTQVPILRMALGLATLFGAAAGQQLNAIRNHILARCVTQILSDESPPGAKETRILGILRRFRTAEINSGTIGPMVHVHFGKMARIENAFEHLVGEDGQSGYLIQDFKLPDYTNSPFDFDALGDAIDLALLYEEAHGNRQIRDYCSQMVTRYKALLEREDYAFLRHAAAGAARETGPFMARLLGLGAQAGGHAKASQIVVVDMNAVEDEVVELVSAVAARMVFRLLRQALSPQPLSRAPPAGGGSSLHLRHAFPLRAGRGPRVRAHRQGGPEVRAVPPRRITLRTKRIVVTAPDDREYILGLSDDVTELRRSEQHVLHLAHHDSLTGLLNRASLVEQLEQLTRSGDEFVVLTIDLDRFKAVNDQFGHPVGDRLLVEAGIRLRRFVSDRDIVARIGGDEFVVVAVGACERATILADHVIAALSEPYSIDRFVAYAGASIGVVVAPKDGKTVETLRQAADLALYRAKASGRGSVCFFSDELNDEAGERRMLEGDLREAIERGEIDVAYQPVVSSVTGQVTSFEALARWRHPQLGPISPARFIGIAEESGMIGLLGDGVLLQACRAAAAWPADIKVAVNLSPLQFESSGLVDTVTTALALSGLPPQRLQLEVTEGLLIRNVDHTFAILTELRNLGVQILLDDFGVGFSSLSYFERFPFDKVKIDQSFVRKMATTPAARAIIQAVVGLGRTLNMGVVAEGVESPEQMQALVELGCTHLQGFLFSEPQAESAFQHILQSKPTATSVIASL